MGNNLERAKIIELLISFIFVVSICLGILMPHLIWWLLYGIVYLLFGIAGTAHYSSK